MPSSLAPPALRPLSERQCAPSARRTRSTALDSWRAPARRRAYRLAWAVSLCLVGAFFWPVFARADPRLEVARSGPVQATLTYDYATGAYGIPSYRRTHLTVVRSGRTLVNRRLTIGDHCRRFCAAWPANFWRHRHSVALRNVDGDRAREILVDLYTGGAHCCFYTYVYDYRPHGRFYRRSTAHWGDPGYRLQDLDGDRRPEFVTGDDRFAYAFASYASSRFPLRILRFQGGRLRAATGDYPRAIRREARGFYSEFRHSSSFDAARGAVAAYAADKARVGEADLAFAQINRARSRLGPSPGKFVGDLRRFLRRLGYLRR